MHSSQQVHHGTQGEKWGVEERIPARRKRDGSRGKSSGIGRLAGCGPGFPLLSPSPFSCASNFSQMGGRGGKGAREKTIYLGRAKNRAPPPPPLFSFPFFAWQKDRWEKMKRGKKKWGACSFLLPRASQRGFVIRNY